MAELIIEVITFLIDSNTALYLAVLGDIIFSIYIAITTKKSKSNTSSGKVVNDDIHALVHYHEKVAQKLKEKFIKE